MKPPCRRSFTRVFTRGLAVDAVDAVDWGDAVEAGAVGAGSAGDADVSVPPGGVSARDGVAPVTATGTSAEINAIRQILMTLLTYSGPGRLTGVSREPSGVGHRTGTGRGTGRDGGARRRRVGRVGA
ncbi:hypothetical protein Skr01_12920 [Sphaerisporangium krabiense]|nr:hypothetical protein Skr01_12920 [Sphaerisporangium krabiense]